MTGEDFSLHRVDLETLGPEDTGAQNAVDNRPSVAREVMTTLSQTARTIGHVGFTNTLRFVTMRGFTPDRPLAPTGDHLFLKK